jgi:hypothetical protein
MLHPKIYRFNTVLFPLENLKFNQEESMDDRNRSDDRLALIEPEATRCQYQTLMFPSSATLEMRVAGLSQQY